MKILVTGGAGYVGSVLVRNLVKEGFNVRVLDRFIFGKESLSSLNSNKRLEIVDGDIRDLELISKSLNGVDVVIHMAALVGEPACNEDPKVTLEINQKATEQIVKKSKEKGVKRFIFISTCSNYGISKEKEANEESKLSPLSLYAKTKIASEKYVLLKNSKSFSVTVLRLATIFGLSPKMRFNLMVNELARETALNRSFEIRNENAWRPFLHVEDASSAIIKILISSEKKVGGQIFNVVSENVRKKDLIKLARKINPKMKIVISDGGKDDNRDYRVSSKKIRRVLSWKPKISVEEGFREVYKAVKNKKFQNPYGSKFNAWFDKKVFQANFNK